MHVARKLEVSKGRQQARSEIRTYSSCACIPTRRLLAATISFLSLDRSALDPAACIERGQRAGYFGVDVQAREKTYKVYDG